MGKGAGRSNEKVKHVAVRGPGMPVEAAAHTVQGWWRRLTGGWGGLLKPLAVWRNPMTSAHLQVSNSAHAACGSLMVCARLATQPSHLTLQWQAGCSMHNPLHPPARLKQCACCLRFQVGERAAGNSATHLTLQEQPSCSTHSLLSPTCTSQTVCVLPAAPSW